MNDTDFLVNYNPLGIRITASPYISDASLDPHGVYDPITDPIPLGSNLANRLVGQTLESDNWGTTTGSQYNLDDGTFKLGGSTSPKLSWDGTTLSISGSVTATSGTIGGWTIGATTLSSSNITLDSANKRIIINDGTNDRVLIGFQSGGF